MRVRVAEDEVPDIEVGIARTQTYRPLDRCDGLRCPTDQDQVPGSTNVCRRKVAIESDSPVEGRKRRVEPVR